MCRLIQSFNIPPPWATQHLTVVNARVVGNLNLAWLGGEFEPEVLSLSSESLNMEVFKVNRTLSKANGSEEKVFKVFENKTACAEILGCCPCSLQKKLGQGIWTQFFFFFFFWGGGESKQTNLQQFKWPGATHGGGGAVEAWNWLTYK